MGADDALLAKLEGMNQEATALEEQLLTPEVASDGLRYSKLAQELSPLKKLVEPYRQYRKTLEELAGAQEMLELEDDEEMKELATEEIETLTQRREELIEQVREAFVSNDPMADRNVIVEVRAGAGGDEASLFAGDLFRMYSRFAERNRWRVEVIDQSPSDVGGFKEVIFRIKGVGAFQRLQFESGGHRVQRVPKTETQGRIHTSMATVGVMPEAEDVDVEIKSEDLRIDTMRAGGPGGQHVNKTESAVRIVHLPTGIEVKCKEKSQHQNRAQAMRLLRAKLFEHEQQKIVQERGELRRTLIGSGDRSARVRTYNVPQNRVTDHRIELTLYDLANILDGAVDPFVEALVERDKQDKLAAL
jgi:peptide chain release factor 1